MSEPSAGCIEWFEQSVLLSTSVETQGHCCLWKCPFFTVQEKARQKGSWQETGINGQLFTLLQSHLHCHHFIKERAPPLPCPPPWEGRRLWVTVFESEPTELWEKLSSGWHRLAPAPGCGWGPSQGGARGLGSEGQVPPTPEGCSQNAAKVSPPEASQTWHRPTYNKLSFREICPTPGRT